MAFGTMIRDTLGDITLAGGLFAIAGGVIKFWWEVQKENRRQRVEVYNSVRKGFDEEEDFFEIFDGLELYAEAKNESEKAHANAILAEIDWRTRMRFAAFIEHVALCAKSGIFSKEFVNRIAVCNARLTKDPDGEAARLRV